MADKCLCHAYFEGVYDKQIKQGQDFDLAQGVRAIDGYGNEVDFTYEPTEIDLCKTGDQEVTYKAFGASFNIIPKLCMPKYKKGVSIPEACPSDLEMITAKRIIRIIRASNPRFLGIPRVTITENEAFDPTEGVTAVDDNGNTIDFSYEGKYDLVAEGDDIATFETEYEQNAKAVEVTLEPIQDLNGYDKPWAGGAGKNKLQVTATSKTLGGITFTVNSDGSIKADGTASGWGGVYKNAGRASLKANTQYTLYAEGGTSGVYYLDLLNGTTKLATTEYQSGVSFTPTEDVEATLDVCVYYNKTVNAQTMYPMLCLASETDTSFAPYSNICPISGHTECVTSVSGVNVWDEEWEVGRYDTTTGASVTSPTQIRCKNFIHVMPNTDYYVKGTSNTSLWIQYYGKDKNIIRQAVTDSNWDSSSGYSLRYRNKVMSLNSECHYIKFYLENSYGTTYNHDISINYPSTDHEYHAYNGTTYTTDLGRTVYGGTLDVVSGVLTVTHGYVDLGTLTWSYSTDRVPRFGATFPFDVNYISHANVFNGASSAYEIVTFDALYNPSTSVNGTMAAFSATRMAVRDDAYTDPTAFQQAVSGVQLVYELATPQTIQLTPQQVELLKGTNNVWSEEGDVRVIYEGNIPQDGSFEYPLEGEYTITYKATDKCGNEGTAERTIVVTPSE